jgi:lipoic acid synthetase
MGECWEQGTATFMILGRICTRACRFCDVDSYSRPGPVDLEEPRRLAETVQAMGLKHAVITSVTRDDLVDGGSTHFVRCLEEIRRLSPQITLEVLTPDFKARREDIDRVIAAAPEVFNHNLETVEELTPRIRSGAQYRRSLDVLSYVKAKAPHIKTKSGLMLGLGETNEQIRVSLQDLREHQVDYVTMGQYLRPSSFHHAVMRYATPEEFAELGRFASELGFERVDSGPLVRSSYHAKA